MDYDYNSIDKIGVFIEKIFEKSIIKLLLQGFIYVYIFGFIKKYGR